VLPELDAYKVLQVDPCADTAVIRAAYLILARRFHPDGTAPDPDRMALINRAYASLRDSDARRRYDQARERTARQSGAAWVPTGPGGQAGAGSEEPHQILDFGRYAGWRLTDLVRRDPDYLRWLARHSSGIRYRRHIARRSMSGSLGSSRANQVA
jgi:curved DNA-binding protein CbpA